MSIFLDRTSRVIAQGITGRMAQFHEMQDHQAALEQRQAQHADDKQPAGGTQFGGGEGYSGGDDQHQPDGQGRIDGKAGRTRLHGVQCIT